MFSVIVPISHEPPEVADLFARFARPPESELLVAPAGDCDVETVLAFEGVGARVISGDGSRGARLARAAGQAQGDALLFLHADSRPPDNALEAARQTLSDAVAGAFSLAYDDARPAMRWIAWWANRRSRWLGLPFGDQGLFCRREAYDRAGGHRDLPICDDVDLVRRLRGAGRLRVRPEKTVTSSRRYPSGGAGRQVLRTWRVLLGYFAGVDPRRLERWYNRE
jgi:rSAM/selenodomain-associated transferase 2